jgi:hypothetical protein
MADASQRGPKGHIFVTAGRRPADRTPPLSPPGGRYISVDVRPSGPGLGGGRIRRSLTCGYEDWALRAADGIARLYGIARRDARPCVSLGTSGPKGHIFVTAGRRPADRTPPPNLGPEGRTATNRPTFFFPIVMLCIKKFLVIPTLAMPVFMAAAQSAARKPFGKTTALPVLTASLPSPLPLPSLSPTTS